MSSALATLCPLAVWLSWGSKQQCFLFQISSPLFVYWYEHLPSLLLSVFLNTSYLFLLVWNSTKVEPSFKCSLLKQSRRSISPPIHYSDRYESWNILQALILYLLLDSSQDKHNPTVFSRIWWKYSIVPTMKSVKSTSHKCHWACVMSLLWLRIKSHLMFTQ